MKDEVYMAITLTATVECDKCGRTQVVPMFGAPTNDQIIDEANRTDSYRWERLDDRGFPVNDYAPSAHVVLCEGCAKAYKALIAEQRVARVGFMGAR